MNDLRFPIGAFEAPEPITSDHLTGWIMDIEGLPDAMRSTLASLNDAQLDTPYRPGGWRVRQLVHHVADSHLNSYVRFKWALTEARPTIKAYDEKAWAELSDTGAPIAISLDLLDALHRRWVVLLRGLEPEQLLRAFIHPDSGTVSVAENIGIYAWHGRHHLAHIERLIDREGWRRG